jgi:hypothetical protein
MKKSSAKSTCKPLRSVLVGSYRQCFDVSDPKDELRLLTKIFKSNCKRGWYTERDGSWAKYGAIRHNSTLQELYKKAVKGDLDSLRTLVCGESWRVYIVRDPNAPINL